MPFTGSAPNKSFIRTVDGQTGSTSWQDLDAAKVGVFSADHDEHDQDIVDGLNAVMMKDGGTAATADLPMGTNKLTNLGSGTARTHSANVGQIQDSAFYYAGTSSGTDTITASVSPAITAYAAGQRFHFRAGGTNTGAATLNLNSVGAADIKKGADGTTALAAGDIVAGGIYTVTYNGSTGDFELVNPKTPVGYIVGTDIQAYSARLAEIAALAADDGNIIVGNGSAWVAESGATARASLGVGSASDSAEGMQENAVQSEMETGTSTTLTVTPGRQAFHPAHPKFWAMATVSGGTPTLQASHNVTGITDVDVGNLRVTIATDFASANWCALLTVQHNGNASAVASSIDEDSLSAGVVDLFSFDTGASANANLGDPGSWHVAGLGDQA